MTQTTEAADDFQALILKEMRDFFCDLTFFESLVVPELKLAIADIVNKKIEIGYATVKKLALRYYRTGRFNTKEEIVMWKEIQQIFIACCVLIISKQTEILGQFWDKPEIMLSKYPSFSNANPYEKNLLLQFRNMAVATLQVVAPEHNKQTIMYIAGRIGGDKKRYVTGSGMSEAVKRRVAIYEQEGQVEPAVKMRVAICEQEGQAEPAVKRRVAICEQEEQVEPELRPDRANPVTMSDQSKHADEALTLDSVWLELLHSERVRMEIFFYRVEEDEEARRPVCSRERNHDLVSKSEYEGANKRYVIASAMSEPARRRVAINKKRGKADPKPRFGQVDPAIQSILGKRPGDTVIIAKDGVTKHKKRNCFRESSFLDFLAAAAKEADQWEEEIVCKRSCDRTDRDNAHTPALTKVSDYKKNFAFRIVRENWVPVVNNLCFTNKESDSWFVVRCKRSERKRVEDTLQSLAAEINVGVAQGPSEPCQDNSEHSPGVGLTPGTDPPAVAEQSVATGQETQTIAAPDLSAGDSDFEFNAEEDVFDGHEHPFFFR